MLKTGNLYQKINLVILWFLNTTGCQCQIISACFMYKIAFDDRINNEYYCDNCMYNCEEARQVPIFETSNPTAKLSMIYAYITGYSNLVLSSDCQKLLARNLFKGPKIAAKQTCICEKTLKNFAL